MKEISLKLRTGKSANHITYNCRVGVSDFIAFVDVCDAPAFIGNTLKTSHPHCATKHTDKATN